MGIRDFAAINALALASGLYLMQDFEMPANNRCLVWCKRRRREFARSPDEAQRNPGSVAAYLSASVLNLHWKRNMKLKKIGF